MDFSKLNANEKLATYGAVAAIVGSVLSFSGIGGGGFGLVTGILMLVIIFLPQFSPGTKLPGSKGSLMILVGGVSALVALLALLSILTVLGAFAVYGGLLFIGLLISIAGQLLMGWASWREFQAEGGKFNVGMSSAPPPAAPPATPPAPPAPPATPMGGSNEPMGGSSMGGSSMGGSSMGGESMGGESMGGGSSMGSGSMGGETMGGGEQSEDESQP